MNRTFLCEPDGILHYCLAFIFVKQFGYVSVSAFSDCVMLITLKYVNRFTYEIAPVFIIMEAVLVKKMQEIIGWKEKESDGIFSPGK